MTEERLPTVSAAGAESVVGAAVPGAPVELESSSVRLVGTLSVAGALAGLAIVLVFQWANPRIEAWRAEVLAAAVTQVLAGAERYETAFLDAGGLTLAPQADTADLDRVYVGFDGDDRAVGIALAAGEPGFQDVIRLMFGYDPETGDVIGMQVLESKETPGLGDKIEKDSSFVSTFDRVGSPLIGVKAGRESGVRGEVTMITGATISSRAVVEIINHRLEVLAEPIAAFWNSSELRGGTP